MITNKDISIDSENGKVTLNGNKYDLGTQGEIDTAVKGVYSVMGQNGAKNLIPYPYHNESGYSDQGLTVTYDADGVFTINKVAGTATAYYRIATLNFLKPSTKYRLVFEVENATSISIFLQKPTTGDYVTINNKSSGIFVAEFETTADSQISTRSIGLSCTASDTETNATVKVMLMLASDTDNTYEPYAMTNKQLTDQLGTKQDAIVDLSYSTTGLTPDANCTIKAGGYVKIGKLVVVNMRVVVTSTGATIAGFPIPAISDQNNSVGGVGYNTSDGSTGCFYINNANGSLIMANNVSSGDILISLVYAAN